MGIEFTNNAEGTLAAGITDSATSITLTAGDGNKFPVLLDGAGDYFYATLVNISGVREIIKVRKRTAGSNVLEQVVRAQDDTAAAAWLTSDKCQLRISKVILETYRDDIATNVTNIAANLAAIQANDVEIADHKARIVVLEANLTAPVGTKMYFYQAAAPNGWVIDAAPADSLLAVQGGSAAYSGTAGTLLGTWTPTSHTHTGPSHTHTISSHTHTVAAHLHTTGNFTLTTAHIPAHTHGSAGAHTHTFGGYSPAGAGAGGFSGSFGPYGGGASQGTAYPLTIISGGAHTHASVGSSGAHNHGNTSSGGPSGNVTGATVPTSGAAGTGATGASNAPSTDRPKAAVGIIATKS